MRKVDVTGECRTLAHKEHPGGDTDIAVVMGVVSNAVDGVQAVLGHVHFVVDPVETALVIVHVGTEHDGVGCGLVRVDAPVTDLDLGRIVVTDYGSVVVFEVLDSGLEFAKGNVGAIVEIETIRVTGTVVVGEGGDDISAQAGLLFIGVVKVCHAVVQAAVSGGQWRSFLDLRLFQEDGLLLV